MTSLKQKAKTGLVWTLIDSFFTKSFTFATAILMTRILSPEEFGLIGLIMIFIALGNALVDGGLGNSIIRDQNTDALDFSTVFYTNLAVSFIVYIILFFGAPAISRYLGQEILIEIIRVYGLIVIITAFSSIQKNILMKNLSFRKLTILSMPGVFIGSATGLAMAYYGYGVWSLVSLQLITQLTTSILIWSKANWTPQFAFSFTRIKYHWSFGYKLLLSSLLNVIFTEVYSVLIGKRFSVQSLGYYNRAKTYNLYPVDLISQVISKVSYPLLSKMKEDKEGVSRTYQSILRSIFFIVTPLMFTLCVLAKPIFLLLFTEKWLDAVPYFQIMTISSILYPVHIFNLNVFKVFDRTDLYLKIALIRQGMVACVVVLGLIFNIYTLLWGMVTISYIALFVNTYYSEKFIGYRTIKQIRDMTPTFLTAGGSAILGWHILSLMPEYNFLVQIFSVSIIITGVYVGLNVILKNQALHEFKSYLLFMIKKG